MRKIVLSSVLALLIGTLAGQPRMVRLTRFEGKAITGVSASASFDVELIRSESTSAVVEINAELEKDLVFDLDARGVIKLGLRPGVRPPHPTLRARIRLGDLRYVEASGASDISCRGAFESAGTTIRLSGSSDLDGLELSCTGSVDIGCSGSSDMDDATIRHKEMKIALSGSSDAEILAYGGLLSCELSGASDLKIAGEADDATVRVSGSSNLSASGLVVKKAKIEASSASNVDFGRVDTELTVRGSGASKIVYRGNPSSGASLSTSSASSVRNVTE